MSRHPQHADEAAAPGPAAALPPAAPAPFELRIPAQRRSPLVVASPHSGDHYPADLAAAAAIAGRELRLSADAFVDRLFAAAPELGAPLLRATYGRAYLDVNREPYELDPAMFEDALPAFVNRRSARVAAGLGTLPRVTAEGVEIYARRLRFAEAEARIERVYRPYHQALAGLVEVTRRRFGACVLIDAHSMPSLTAAAALPLKGADVVLGDRRGASCAAALTDAVEQALAGLGYRVVRNQPYAGGFTTEHYGRPAAGVHVLQIEINRGLYMDEATLEPAAGFAAVARDMGRLLEAIAGIDRSRLESA